MSLEYEPASEPLHISEVRGIPAWLLDLLQLADAGS